MIPTADELIAGYPFVARRHRRVAHFDRAAVQSVVELASRLASDREADEPAALFFALASVRRAFPFAWRLMARVTARTHATNAGLVLGARDEDLDGLCNDVLFRRAGYAEVRAWFAKWIAVRRR